MIKKIRTLTYILLLIFSLNYVLISQQLFIPFDSINNIDSVEVKFSAVGDLMCHGTQLLYAKTDKDSFDFRPVYRMVKSIFDSSDFVMGNLETVIETPNLEYAGYPVFNSPGEFLEALKFSGFDFLFTTNNHSADQGPKGLASTIDALKKAKLEYHGTFLSKNDRDSVRIFYKNGISFAVLSYTYDINGDRLPENKNFMINRIDTLLMMEDFNRAKKMTPDFILTYLHFGTEYKREPSNYQRRIVDKVKSLGADIIISSHPHTIQPIEFFETTHSKLDSGFVIYSLGNFISNQRWRYSDAGVILNFEIKKNVRTGALKLKEVSFTPTWVYKGFTGQSKEFIVYPAEEVFSDSLPGYFSEKDKELMKESYFDTIEVITKYTNRPKLIRKYFNN